MILIAFRCNPTHAADDAFKKHFNKSITTRAFEVAVLLNRPDDGLTLDCKEVSVSSRKTSDILLKPKGDKDGEGIFEVVKLVEHKAPGSLTLGGYCIIIN